MGEVDPWQLTRKLAQLPGTKTSAELVLARTLEKAKAGHIASVVVLIQWAANDCVEADWSRQPRKDLAHKKAYYDSVVQIECAPIQDME